MREIDETFAYIVREKCNAALRWQARAAEVRVSLARLDGRFADASTHQTRANRLLGLVEPHEPVSFPPIPAAARKPRVGEVWMVDLGGAEHAPRLVAANMDDAFFAISCLGHFKRRQASDFARPATPEEAEPFRDLLDGLKRSLGETEGLGIPASEESK